MSPKRINYIFVIGFLCSIAASSRCASFQPTPIKYADPIRIAADAKKGFDYPYFLFVPANLLDHSKQIHARLLVVPNNTGTVSDDESVHERSALREANDWRRLATSLNVGLLVPVFPRPASNDLLYTHALGRSAMLTTDPRFAHIDRQLLRMIDDARKQQRKSNIDFDKRVFMLGFSASGMFTNRFVFMHPDRTQAAAIGSPGGWAIAPVAHWKNVPLRYPIGVADFKSVTGTKFDLHAVADVPQFLFVGDADQNDSVVYHDSYEEQDRKLVFELFGTTLMDRWKYTEEMYKKYLPLATLKIYPGAKHEYTKAMVSNIEEFFRAHMENR